MINRSSGRGTELLVCASLIICTALASLIPGCSSVDEYVIHGKVKSTVDGMPLNQVQISLVSRDTDRVVESMETGPDGSFRMPFSVWDQKLAENWSLFLKREGYVDEVIDIGPFIKPEGTSHATPILVVAYMRAAGGGVR